MDDPPQIASIMPIGQESISRLESTSVSNPGYLPDPCGILYAFAWIRAGTEPDLYAIAAGNSSLPNPSATAVTCEPRIEAAYMNVTVDATGIVLNIDPDALESIDTDALFPTGPTGIAGFEYINDLLRFLTKDYTLSGYWHTGAFASDWLNYLVKLRTGSDANVNPRMVPPTPDDMAGVVGEVLQRAFAMRLGLNPQWMDSSATKETRMGFVEHEERRVFFAPYMYELSMALLSFNLLVALLVLCRRPGRLLHRSPTTIGAILSSMAGSTVLDDVVAGRITPSESVADAGEFAHGKFIGTDGTPRLGVERHPFVMTLESITWYDKLRHRIGRSIHSR